ncbi:hypothetical protein D3C86_1256430 [compost metagenome]
MQTITVTDHKLVSPTLARVIVAFTGDMNGEAKAAMLTEQLKYLGAPVENSFRSLGRDTAVGFVRANREIREFDDTRDPKTGQITARAQYKVMSNNVLMDNKDRSLWQVKDGPGGKYLARHGNENLAELIEATTNYSRTDVPKLSRISDPKAARGEFAAFCGLDGNMDYGFVTRVSASKTEVVSMASHRAVVIPNQLIASLTPVGIDKDIHKQVMARVQTRDEKSKQIEYWKTLYAFDKPYADAYVTYVNNMATM